MSLRTAWTLVIVDIIRLHRKLWWKGSVVCFMVRWYYSLTLAMSSFDGLKVKMSIRPSILWVHSVSSISWVFKRIIIFVVQVVRVFVAVFTFSSQIYILYHVARTVFSEFSRCSVYCISTQSNDIYVASIKTFSLLSIPSLLFHL